MVQDSITGDLEIYVHNLFSQSCREQQHGLIIVVPSYLHKGKVRAMRMSNTVKKILLSVLLVCGLLFFPTISLATSVLGGSINVQRDGNVTATFQGSNAAYISSLYLGDTKIFTTTQARGSTFDLGNFFAGTELNFRLEVHNTANTFYSGSAGNNSDGIAHAFVDDTFGNNETLVSFEDLLGGGDRDYNDLIFSFTNTEASGLTTTQMPEPSAVILVGSGILGLVAWKWNMEYKTHEFTIKGGEDT